MSEDNGKLSLRDFVESPKFVEVSIPPLRNTIPIKVLTVQERLNMAAAVRGCTDLEINCEMLRRTVDLFKDQTDEQIADMSGPVGALIQECMRVNGFSESATRKNG